MILDHFFYVFGTIIVKKSHYLKVSTFPVTFSLDDVTKSSGSSVVLVDLSIYLLVNDPGCGSQRLSRPDPTLTC